jgi:hypothetical protein
MTCLLLSSCIPNQQNPGGEGGLHSSMRPPHAEGSRGTAARWSHWRELWGGKGIVTKVEEERRTFGAHLQARPKGMPVKASDKRRSPHRYPIHSGSTHASIRDTILFRSGTLNKIREYRYKIREYTAQRRGVQISNKSVLLGSYFCNMLISFMFVETSPDEIG